MNRHHRGLTLAEAAIVLAIMAAASLITLAALNPSSSGAASRAAQSSADQATQTVLDAQWDTGDLTADPVTLAGYDLSVTYLDATTTSTASTDVSVAVDNSAGVLAVAVSDGTEHCWMRLVRLSPAASQLPSLMVATSTLDCTGTAALGLEPLTPPADSGGSWSKPWVIDS